MTFMKSLKTRSKAVIAFLLSLCMLACLMTGFHALAEDDRVTLSFDLNGGSLSEEYWGSELSPRQIEKDSTYMLLDGIYLKSPDTEKLVFDGWSYDKEGKNKVRYRHGAYEAIISEDSTVYANWKNQIYVSFDAMGGSFISDDIAETVIKAPVYDNAGKFGNLKVPNDPELAGKKFSGWHFDKECTEDSFVADPSLIYYSEDTTLYAKWQDGYSVTYDYNGGKYTYSNTNLKKQYCTNEAAELPISYFSAPDEKKVLEGWYTDKSFDNDKKISEPTAINKDTTLFAHWVDGYTVTLKSLSLSMSDSPYESSYLVLPGSTLEENISMYNDKENVVFGGFFTEQNGKGDRIETEVRRYSFESGNFTAILRYTPSSDTVLYGYWTKPITLHFDANGNEEYEKYVPKDQKRAPGVKWSDGDHLEYMAHGFKGWSPDKDAAEGVALNEYVATKSETLYAIWEKEEEPTSQKQEEPTSQKQEEPTSQKQEEPTSQKQEEPTSQKQEEPTSQKQEDPTEPDKPAEKLNGVVKGPDGKWGYYKNDVLQEKYTGFQKNEYGYWYIVNGYVDFDRNDILRDGENGWWKVEGGKVNFNYTGVAKNKYGWWRVENGLVNFNAQGIYKNDYGWWKTTDGKVTFQENGVFKNEYGWWKVEDSKVNFKYTGVAKNEYGWWRIEKGKVNFKFTGIAKNEYGTWYINKGKVDFNKNGKVKYDGKVYKVTNGKAKLA